MSDRNDERDKGSSDIDPDAPPTAEEALAASQLRDALELGRAGNDPTVELAHSLRAAWAPDPLRPEDHLAILADLPTAEELELAEELRKALDDMHTQTRTHGQNAPDVVTALRAAWSPAELTEQDHQAIIARALGTMPATGNVVAFRSVSRRARITRVVVVGTTTALALAASVVVWMTNAPNAQELPLARARSTQPLFGEPFRPGEASARIDKIAIARASDYRDNRFAKWGAR